MSWGNRLLLVFIVFAGGMLFLVYKSTQVNFELVEKEYYKSELQYQRVIDGVQHANSLSASVIIKKENDSILLSMPPEMKNKPITGRVWFYCSYDEKRDKKFSLQPAVDGIQRYDARIFLPGSYIVKVEWIDEGRDYFSEQQFNILE